MAFQPKKLFLNLNLRQEQTLNLYEANIDFCKKYYTKTNTIITISNSICSEKLVLI